MTRDQIIETMARGMFDACPPLRLTGEPILWDDTKSFTPMNCRADAAAALSALEAAGLVVVPRHLLTERQRQIELMENAPERHKAIMKRHMAMIKAAQGDKP